MKPPCGLSDHPLQWLLAVAAWRVHRAADAIAKIAGGSLASTATGSPASGCGDRHPWPQSESCCRLAL